MARIRPFVGNELVKVLTGLRRSGKSVMLKLIQEELSEKGVQPAQIISYNFEKMENRRLCTAEALHAEIKKRVEGIEGMVYMFFDEIQEVDSWELCINSFRVEFDCDIYITGSNAKLLSGELATYLGGRYAEFIIYPFSFKEFLDARQTPIPQTNLAAAFREYMSMGGMPFMVTNLLNDKDAASLYLQDLYNSVVLKNVVKRAGIRDVDLLERIVTYVMANVGHPFSAASISKYFKSEKRSVSHETVMNYIKACENAYLFYRANRQDLIGKKVLAINEKYYVADHGLREAVYGENGRDIDQTLENIVYMELLRRGYKVTVGKAGDKEIDFVGKRQGQLLYVQVSYLLASEETIAREFAPFYDIRDNYPKYVVSMDEFDLSRDGIKHMNIRDFLLAPEWV